MEMEPTSQPAITTNTNLSVSLPDGEVQRRVSPLVLVVEQAVGRRGALQQELNARLVAAGTRHVQHRRAILEVDGA